jgi:hypothetical protein
VLLCALLGGRVGVVQRLYGKHHFLEAGLADHWDPASFERMVDGTAFRPYVYRHLLPDAANSLDSIMPFSIKHWLYQHQGSGPDAYISAISISQTASKSGYFFRYLFLYITTFLFALLAVYAMYLVCRALEVPPPAAVFTPVIFILLVPYIMSRGGFFYDYVELAFMALAVWIAIRFDWWWLVPLAVLGAWNQETFLVFIPTLYPFFRMRRSRLGALQSVGVLCSVCAAIYRWTHLRFAHNPGSIVELGWPAQLQSFIHVRSLLIATEETYGVRMLALFTVIPMTLLIWTVWRGWRHLPRAVQRHGQIAAAINIPLFLLFGAPGELRALSMLYIVLLLLLASNLNEWISNSTRASVSQVS